MQIEFLVLILVGVFGVAFFLWRKRATIETPRASEAVLEAKPEVQIERPPALAQALKRTRSHWLDGLKTWVGRQASDLQSSEWEALEETLLMADVSIATSQSLIAAVRSRSHEGPGKELTGLLQAEIEALLEQSHRNWELPEGPRPYVISIVGVNGVGKTTTVGKLAALYSKADRKVLVGACDTFRAAAIGQLEIWAQRASCQFVSGREGADPGATAFDAVSAGVARGMDLVLLDTAGRLHTKVHLMDELKRVHKVVKKVLPEAPHEVWLVVDGTMGQNALVQAKQFHEALGLNGVVLTKLDGTAKGGTVLSIMSELKLPVRFVGIGEKAEDLIPFSPSEFAQGLLS
jgi:fused signal recognition particle receptor